MKEQKLKVGTDVLRSNQYDMQLAQKQLTGKSLLSHVTKTILLKDKVAFLNNPEQYFTDEFTEQYASTFPPMLSHNKKIELVEFDTIKFKKLVVEFQSITLELDGDLNPVHDKPDFSMYITNAEQIKTYKARLELLKAINKYKSSGGQIGAGKIMAGFPNAFTFDWDTNELNANY